MVLLKVTIQNRWRTIQIGSWDSVKADHHHHHSGENYNKDGDKILGL